VGPPQLSSVSVVSELCMRSIQRSSSHSSESQRVWGIARSYDARALEGNRQVETKHETCIVSNRQSLWRRFCRALHVDGRSMWSSFVANCKYSTRLPHNIVLSQAPRSVMSQPLVVCSVGTHPDNRCGQRGPGGTECVP
jgi:hypothetical protein